jgi:dGTP triphosphohydrolase
MNQPILFSLRASIVPFQLLRPLPTIFASVAGVSGECAVLEMPPAVRKEFHDHLDCMAKTVKVLSEASSSLSSECDALLEKMNKLDQEKTYALCEETSAFNHSLERMCENHKEPVKEECRAHAFTFRDIYRKSVHVKKVTLIFQDEANERVSSLKDLLCDKCYYDVELKSEESLHSSPVRSDFALYAPTSLPGQVYLDGMPNTRVPLLLMVDLGKKLEECSIADLRRVFRHQQRNIDILYSPFPPIRLFQKIDIGYIEHLYQPRVKTSGHN